MNAEITMRELLGCIFEALVFHHRRLLVELPLLEDAYSKPVMDRTIKKAESAGLSEIVVILTAMRDHVPEREALLKQIFSSASLMGLV